MWHLSGTRVLIAFSQHSHSFWLSPFLSSYLSQTLPVISSKLLPILLRLLLILHPSVFTSGPRIHHRPPFQRHRPGSHKADGVLVFLLSRVSVCGTRISFSAEFPATALGEGGCCGFFFHSLFTYRTHSVLKGSQCPLAGEGGTYHKSVELQCSVLWTCKILCKSLNL